MAPLMNCGKIIAALECWALEQDRPALIAMKTEEGTHAAVFNADCYDVSIMVGCLMRGGDAALTEALLAVVVSHAALQLPPEEVVGICNAAIEAAEEDRRKEK
ncbi:hypothetical protein HDR58_02025 [bacterium]|nr:hypothetical protein [bacterium]